MVNDMNLKQRFLHFPKGLLKLLTSGEPQVKQLLGIIYDNFKGKRSILLAAGPKNWTERLYLNAPSGFFGVKVEHL